MCVMEGQGADGHVGDDFLCCFMSIFFHDGFEMVLTQFDSPCIALNVKVVRKTKTSAGERQEKP